MWLLEEHNVKCGLTTLKDRFRKWGIRRRMSEEVEAQLKNRIVVLFFQCGFEDGEILQMLHNEGHTHISRSILVRLRFSMGLKRRIRDPAEKEAAIVAARAAIEEHLKEGIIDGYGKRLLQVHFKQRGLFFARDRLFQEYRNIHPEAVTRRLNDHQRRRGEYIVPGPNWC